MLGLPSSQINFTQAFLNADIDGDVYIAIPQGWYYDPAEGKLIQHEDPAHHNRLHCIKLLKNLYGTKQAARNWFLCLSKYLQRKHGFKPSQSTLVSLSATTA
jgi:hypothetical protein